MRGDNADPSAVKIGDTYWASSTTSNWFPAYPLMSSKDLVNWTRHGYVFDKLPEWADYYFWAPEISYENGKVYIYYSAHKKGGNLCVGIASADKPEGPYTDHGPIICEPAGSIDAFPMRDENGKLFIIWKEDGNSIKQPTPIWAQELNEERTTVIGEKKELFRNSQPWEGNLVEGVAMIRKNGYFYAFYAAAGCCGIACTYTSGVARAKSLLGPWEKYDKNPLLTNNDRWLCPGHGTPVEKDGRYYFLYHAYDKVSTIYTGRQGVLKEFEFTEDNWVRFIDKPLGDDLPLIGFKDAFDGTALNEAWQWSIFTTIEPRLQNGELILPGDTTVSGSYLGTKILSGDFTATLKISRGTGAAAGLAVIGDDENLVTLFYDKNLLRVVQIQAGKTKEIGQLKVPATAQMHLRMRAVDGNKITFTYSVNGSGFRHVPGGTIDGSYLPPWDRALRIGPVSKGIPSATAAFDNFEVIYK
ncbi:MAG: glycoside hydrolase [Chitinophagaceae bacterium]|nr:MAG: glycoside hydrolase [Chitinophagaceae bacterium]